jgi:hypothetical protein
MRRAALFLSTLSIAFLALSANASSASATSDSPPSPGILSPGARILNVPSAGEYTWNQGNPVTFMGTATNRTCFLTRVTGRFEGWGEVVQAYISDGSWYLGGSSQQLGVGAFARCVAVPSDGEFSWHQNQPPTPMGGDAGRACFLTRVTGHFEGGGESVHAYTSGGSWYLGGSSLQTDVAASANCITVTFRTGEFSWSQGSPPLPMISVTSNSCFLTGMSGRFKGAGEVVYASFLDLNQWFLTGSSQQVGVTAQARCI